MKAILQRVTESHVTVESKVVGKTGFGILVLLGVSKEDNESDADFLIQKTVQLRMFDDPQGKMNLSALDVKADILVVSQFTIYGDCRKGRRPSFDQAANPQTAEHLYEYYVKGLRDQGLKVETGQFRAMMQVSLVNDGPVTFILESNLSDK
ncbi:MAG: D-tyrosyl-tRNA(Tyr) deacylase [Candidatus Omnitrophica bacterium]|nr:D-tyrosyl-tRNA(Tyr) deacylase [Candidatus Omnitrophota bacterium]